jgi:hypothetical protein
MPPWPKFVMEYDDGDDDDDDDDDDICPLLYKKT